MVLLLFTANGIFEPLEVALNRAWGEVKNRSYLKNQLVALGMIFLCGALALLSLMLTALNKQWISTWQSLGAVQWWLNLLMFKLAAVPHLDSGAVPDLLAAAQPQDRAGARGASRHLRGPGPRSPQVRKPAPSRPTCRRSWITSIPSSAIPSRSCCGVSSPPWWFWPAPNGLRAPGPKIRYRKCHEELGRYRAGPRPRISRRASWIASLSRSPRWKKPFARW